MRSSLMLVGCGVALAGAGLPGCALQDASFPGETGDTYAPAEWQDADGDGYVLADDCVDEDAAIHPLAEELCDGLDNDCDGQTDEDARGVWHVDADGDGYGDPDATEEACEQPEGAVDNALDCDDDDAAVSPGATEVERDGIDNDCDGAYLPWEGAQSAEELERAEIWGVDEGDGTYADSSDYAGKRLISVGDLSGDGASDLVLAATASDASETERDNGGAFVFRGPVLGAQTLETAEGAYYGTAGGLAGYGLSALGDLDGSGTVDVGMGNYGSRYWIMLSSPEEGAPLIPGNVLYEGGGSSNFGLSAQGGADYDGDGQPDLVIGAPVAESHRGAAYLFAGDLLTAAVGDEWTRVQGVEADGQAGTAVAMVDLDTDGVAELIVGAPYVTEADPRSGAAYVFDSGQRGVLSVEDALVASHDITNCGMGATLASAGDVTGDGADDLLIGGSACAVGSVSGAGDVWLVAGDPAALSGGEISLAAQFTGQKAYDYLGVGLTNAGDLDGDGANEVLIGAPGRNERDLSGLAVLWYGPVEAYSNPLEEAAATFHGTAYNEQLGYSVGGGYDLTGDGWPDLVFGGPAAEGLGVARVVSGTAL